jgi:hypothetical protein
LKRLTLVLSLMLCCFAAPAVASAHAPTGRHFGVYRYVYRHALKQFGHRTVGCELVYTCTARPVTDAMVVVSTHVMERMLHPPKTFQASAGLPAEPVVPVNGLVRCIIQAESGGNPQAVNGQYEGLGQWSPYAWANDGGLKYAPSPLQATASQQIAVLNAEVAAGTTSQQTDYDPC